MMINRLLIVPGVEHAMQNIDVNLCLLLLRPRRSMHSTWIQCSFVQYNEDCGQSLCHMIRNTLVQIQSLAVSG